MIRPLPAAFTVLVFSALGSAQTVVPEAQPQESITKSLLDLRSDAVPEHRFTTVGGPDASGSFGDKVVTRTTSRGVVTTFDDDFSTYPTSTDPIFDRFQINMGTRVNPSGGTWDFSQFWYIPTFFVDGQVDADDPSLLDPLPRWQGVALSENADLGSLVADINVLGGDGVVDSADLGTLIADFGTSNPRSDINIPGGDGVVDTADLGLLISEFGQTVAPFCSYVVTNVNAIDPDGVGLDPATIANAPLVGDIVAILNSGSSAKDDNLDGCPDCGFFNILADGAVSGERVYGDWTLQDPELIDLSAINFRADVDATSCDGWGSEIVFADARPESFVTDPSNNLGSRSLSPLLIPSLSQPLIMECDFFLTSYDMFVWFDTTSSVEGFTVTRMFMGGFAPAISADWLKYSTGGDGLINHFMFLGSLPPMGGQVFGSVPDPALPELAGVANVGKEIPLNEWFTISFRLTQSDVSIWLRDSETMTLTDPMSGDDGSGTPMDGSDDIEDGFAKLFPLGPFGITPGIAGGQQPQIPQPPLAAVSMDTFRWVYGFDPPGASLRTVFFDNLHAEGILVAP